MPKSYNTFPGGKEVLENEINLDHLQHLFQQNVTVDVLSEFQQAQADSDDPMKAGAERFTSVFSSAVGESPDLTTFKWRSSVAMNPDYLKRVTDQGIGENGTTAEKWILTRDYGSRLAAQLLDFCREHPENTSEASQIWSANYMRFKQNETGLPNILVGQIASGVIHEFKQALAEEKGAAKSAAKSVYGEIQKAKYRSPYDKVYTLANIPVSKMKPSELNELEGVLLEENIDNPEKMINLSHNLLLGLFDSIHADCGGKQAGAYKELIHQYMQKSGEGAGGSPFRGLISLSNLLTRRSPIFQDYELEELNESNLASYPRAIDRTVFAALRDPEINQNKLRRTKDKLETIAHCTRLLAQQAFPRLRAEARLSGDDLRIRYPELDQDTLNAFEEATMLDGNEYDLHKAYRSLKTE